LNTDNVRRGGWTAPVVPLKLADAASTVLADTKCLRFMDVSLARESGVVPAAKRTRIREIDKVWPGVLCLSAAFDFEPPLIVTSSNFGRHVCRYDAGMTQYKRLPIIALAISAAWSTSSYAQESSATTQCAALMSQEKIAEAELHCAQAAEGPGKFGKLLHADFLVRKRELDDATRLYAEILEGVDLAKPTQTEYLALRNRVLMAYTYQRPFDENDAHAALKLVPDDVELLEAGARASPSQLQRLEYADRLIALDPNSVKAHVLRSYALTGIEKFQDALASANAASKLDPNSPLPLVARGFAHSMMSEFAKAERDYAAAARKAPNEPHPKVSQAEMLAQLERFDEAIEVATEALKLRPNYPHALRLRASARLWMGDAEGALADLDVANKIEPHFQGLDMHSTAEEMLEAQKAMQPESIASMELDRQIVLADIKTHLHRTCGYYSVPNSHDDDNSRLSAYRDCITAWYRTEGDDMEIAAGPDGIVAKRHFQAIATWVEQSEVLQCSKMPAKSRCIPDSLYARAVAASEVSDLRAVVGDAEFERLNQEIVAYKASAKRRKSLINTASFSNAVGRGSTGQ
jgi:tetratricopeptide (TPR) repeat protein